MKEGSPQSVSPEIINTIREAYEHSRDTTDQGGKTNAEWRGEVLQNTHSTLREGKVEMSEEEVRALLRESFEIEL